MCVAPAAIASAGVTTRLWSPRSAPVGLMPGFTIANWRSDGGGEVVIFQIEKDAASRGDQLAHDLRAFGSEELHADFVGTSGFAHGRHNCSGSGRGGHVESDDQMLPRVVYLTIVY